MRDRKKPEAALQKFENETLSFEKWTEFNSSEPMCFECLLYGQSSEEKTLKDNFKDPGSFPQIEFLGNQQNP